MNISEEEKSGKGKKRLWEGTSPSPTKDDDEKQLAKNPLLDKLCKTR
jgi:hypothetical protein